MPFDPLKDRPKVTYASEMVADPRAFLDGLDDEPRVIAEGGPLGVVIPFALYCRLTGYEEPKRSYTIEELVGTEMDEAFFAAMEADLEGNEPDDT